MRCIRFAIPLAVLALPVPALASFHFMQIEQVVGGLGGDTSQQAIQLRMRSGGQNMVSASRLVARDAAGVNPVLLLDITTNVSGFAAGSTVLLVTPAFAAAQDPAQDFVLAAPIPTSYLAAGRLTFEDDFGTILWSLCWGGAGYTGGTTGSTTNDGDGQFGPCDPDPLPSTTGQALRFTGTASAASSNNSADYAPTPGDALFTNNAGAAALVVPPIFVNGFED